MPKIDVNMVVAAIFAVFMLYYLGSSLAGVRYAARCCFRYGGYGVIVWCFVSVSDLQLQDWH